MPPINFVQLVRRGGWPLRLVASFACLVLAACSSWAEQSTGLSDCTVSDNLMEDLQFTQLGGMQWQYVQHAGERSFTAIAEDGVLEISRTGPEPWMILRQRIEHGVLKGGRLIFSADVKGSIGTEPQLHGFPHVAGLWLQSGDRAVDSVVAEHLPNQGYWDWQRIEIQTPTSTRHSFSFAGFAHQAYGTVWIKNPVLRLEVCGTH